MPNLPDNLLDLSADEGVRQVALALMQDSIAHHQRLTDPANAEALHDFRVAIRRLRSWLRSYRDLLGKRIIRDGTRALRRVARATNSGRDAEVLAAWLRNPGNNVSEELRAWCAGEADAVAATAVGGATEDVNRHFARMVESLEERLPLYQVTRRVGEPAVDQGARFAGVAATGIRRALQGLHRRLVQIRTADDDEAIHRARLAGKRLRYLLEPLASQLPEVRASIQRLKMLQDMLGDAHDTHVWRAELEQRVLLPDRPLPGMRHDLASLLGERIDTSYQLFVADWQGDRWESFAGQIGAIAALLEQHHASGVEIERKYLLFTLPSVWPVIDVQEIEQGYLPGARLVERLRHTRSGEVDRWYRTVKSGTGTVRLEIEEETTREVFEVMWPLTLGRRVTKRRHRVGAGALTWEIDEFTDRDLVLAEVELPSATHPVEFPDWLTPVLVREVTGEDEYVNANLAR